MLDEANIITIANAYLDVYRGILLIDPLFRFNVRIVSSGPTSQTIKDDNSKLSWILQLNASQHSSAVDIRDSTIDFLSDIMLVDMSMLNGDLVKDVKERISCRLFCALRNVLPELPEEEE